jgi:hypothetical protein
MPPRHAILFAPILLVTACLDSATTRCGDLLCPPHEVCTPSGDRCVLADQLTACDGVGDGMACQFTGTSNGICNGGVCFAAGCGDGMITGSEDCEGTNLNGKTCSDLGYYQETSGLACKLDCTFDTSGCQGFCGDHVLNGPEVCEPGAMGTLGGATCASLGFYDEPGLGCTSFCTFDTSLCTGFCGDGMIDGPESCDGAPSGTCLDYGADMGALGCSELCAPDLGGCRQSFGWNRMTTDQPLIGFDGVWGDAVDDLYAVGTSGYILHSDGEAWTTLTDISVFALDAIWGSGPSDIFATGWSGTIVHYDGSSWSPMASGLTDEVVAIDGTGPADVYAVDAAGTIIHYGGTSWSPVSTGQASSLHGIWASGPGDVFAVGTEGVILRGNATSGFAPMASGSPFGYFNAVAGSGPNDVYAVGDGGLILHYDGMAWTPVPSGTIESLNSVSVNGPNDVIVVGTGGTILRRTYGGFAPMASGTTRTLFHVWGTGTGDVYAAGDGMILVYHGTSWSTTQTPGFFLAGIWGSGPTDVFAFGVATVYHDDGQGFTATSVGTSTIVFSRAWGSGPSDVFAVAGDIYHYDGTTWSLMTAPASGMNAIWGTGPNDVYAVGGSGAIVHYDGTSWSQVDFNPGYAYYGIWGSGPNDVTAVGLTVMRHFDGVSWTDALPSALYATYLRAIWGSGPNDVYAVGSLSSSGQVLHWDGTAWSNLFTDQSTIAFENVYGTGANDVFVAGDGGRLLHWDGGGWTTIGTPTTSANLLGVWTAGPSDAVYLVADDGAIHSLSREFGACGGVETSCDDYWDNDCDGLVDACDPDCAGKIPTEKCGNDRDDDCDGLVDCMDPDCSISTRCRKGGTCDPAPAVTCGETLMGTTMGHEDRIDSYSCPAWATGEYGLEAYARFVPTTSGMVTAALAGFVPADLDLFVFGTATTGACDPGACVTYSVTTNSPEVVSFPVTAGETYYFVVDSKADASAFTLELQCM